MNRLKWVGSQFKKQIVQRLEAGKHPVQNAAQANFHSKCHWRVWHPFQHLVRRPERRNKPSAIKTSVSTFITPPWFGLDLCRCWCVWSTLFYLFQNYNPKIHWCGGFWLYSCSLELKPYLYIIPLFMCPWNGSRGATFILGPSNSWKCGRQSFPSFNCRAVNRCGLIWHHLPLASFLFSIFKIYSYLFEQHHKRKIGIYKHVKGKMELIH